MDVLFWKSIPEVLLFLAANVIGGPSPLPRPPPGGSTGDTTEEAAPADEDNGYILTKYPRKADYWRKIQNAFRWVIMLIYTLMISCLGLPTSSQRSSVHGSEAVCCIVRTSRHKQTALCMSDPRSCWVQCWMQTVCFMFLLNRGHFIQKASSSPRCLKGPLRCLFVFFTQEVLFALQTFETVLLPRLWLSRHTWDGNVSSGARKEVKTTFPQKSPNGWNNTAIVYALSFSIVLKWPVV